MDARDTGFHWRELIIYDDELEVRGLGHLYDLRGCWVLQSALSCLSVSSVVMTKSQTSGFTFFH